MPVRIAKKQKQEIVAVNLEKNVIYPFISNFTVNMSNYPTFPLNGQLCGSLFFNNLSEIVGKVVLQTEVIVRQSYIQTEKIHTKLIILNFQGGAGSTEIYNEGYSLNYERTAPNAKYPIVFTLNKNIIIPHKGQNDLVGLFIYAYKTIQDSSSTIKINLAYFDRTVNI